MYVVLSRRIADTEGHINRMHNQSHNVFFNKQKPLFFLKNSYTYASVQNWWFCIWHRQSCCRETSKMLEFFQHTQHFNERDIFRERIHRVCAILSQMCNATHICTFHHFATLNVQSRVLVTRALYISIYSDI